MIRSSTKQLNGMYSPTVESFRSSRIISGSTQLSRRSRFLLHCRPTLSTVCWFRSWQASRCRLSDCGGLCGNMDSPSTAVESFFCSCFFFRSRPNIYRSSQSHGPLFALVATVASQNGCISTPDHRGHTFRLCITCYPPASRGSARVGIAFPVYQEPMARIE